uniref:Uncharacterized protein n=1 Tax=Knipowitschia caucasica TaxID=637954 RepID=A0AAV2JWE1_KNICA
MAEGDKRRTPSREVPSTGKIYKTSLETRMANLRLRECSAREGRMYTFGGLDGGTDARRTLGGPINSHQAAGARPKTGLLSGPSSSTTSGRSMLPGGVCVWGGGVLGVGMFVGLLGGCVVLVWGFNVYVLGWGLGGGFGGGWYGWVVGCWVGFIGGLVGVVGGFEGWWGCVWFWFGLVCVVE